MREDSLQKLGGVAALDSSNRNLIELRSEAAACLGKLDIREVARFTRPPKGGSWR